MNQTGKRAEEIFETGFYCAESVVKAIALQNGVDAGHLIAIATGFCSGMARSSQVCGAVTGAIMGLGLIFGRKSSQDSTDLCYEATQDFIEGFRKQHGSINCRELIGLDLGDEKELAKFISENPGFETCKAFSANAASLAQEIIDQNKGILEKQG
mgnify:CR=1 FL=1